MAKLTDQQLAGMGFSPEAIRAASRREYSTEGEIIDACHCEQMRLLKRPPAGVDMHEQEPLTYAQIHAVIETIIRRGYHIVPASEATAKNAAHASTLKDLFVLHPIGD